MTRPSDTPPDEQRDQLLARLPEEPDPHDPHVVDQETGRAIVAAAARRAWRVKAVAASRYGADFDLFADTWAVLETEHDKQHPDRGECGGVGACSMMMAAHDLETAMVDALEGWRLRLARSPEAGPVLGEDVPGVPAGAVPPVGVLAALGAPDLTDEQAARLRDMIREEPVPPGQLLSGKQGPAAEAAVSAECAAAEISAAAARLAEAAGSVGLDTIPGAAYMATAPRAQTGPVLGEDAGEAVHAALCVAAEPKGGLPRPYESLPTDGELTASILDALDPIVAALVTEARADGAAEERKRLRVALERVWADPMGHWNADEAAAAAKQKAEMFRHVVRDPS